MRCDLVPIPVLCEVKEGFLTLSPRINIAAPAELEKEAKLLATWLSLIQGVAHVGLASIGESEVISSGDRSTDNRRSLSLEESAHISKENASTEISLSLDSDMQRAEEYELSITSQGIRIVAKDAAGIVRGAASLYQLVLSQGWTLSSLRIRDWPRFAWRGFMLDCARNFFSVEFIEKMLDLAAFHKLNVFHWHLTDDQAWRLEIASKPELTAKGAFRQDIRYKIEWKKGGFYSKADVARIVEYAAIRHIMVVPEIETPGHSTALLAAHPEFSCRGAIDPKISFKPEDHYGIFEDILCAGNERVLAFIDEVLDEVCAMFPAPYVHMGGDEAPKSRWLSCPACRLRMDTLGMRSPEGNYEPELLQAWFMNRIAEMLARRGKRMIGWDEVLEGGIRKDAVIMSWRGIEHGISAASLGYEVVMCPQTKACYLDHKHLDVPEEPGHLGVCTVKDAYSFDPVPDGVNAEQAAHILGGQANLWSELVYFGRQAEYMLFPRLCALSEVFWSLCKNRDFDDFSSRLTAHKRRLDLLDVLYFKGKLF